MIDNSKQIREARFRVLLHAMEIAQEVADASGKQVWIMQHRYRDGSAAYFWTQAPNMRAKPYKSILRVEPRP